MDTSTLISLRDAVERYRAEPGAPSNVYEWYRKSAHRSGRVWVGGIEIRAAKDGNQWVLPLSEFEAAVDVHRARRAQIASVTADYEAHVVHEGDQTLTWGGYRTRGDFHFAWNDMDVYRRKSDGHWRCSRCFSSVQREDGKPECSTCSNWGSCRRDCTLSAISCAGCGTRLEF